MAREIVTLHQFLNRLNPQLDDCPRICPLEDDRERESFCETCEVGKQYEFFRQSFEETAAKRELAPEWSFATLYRDVVRVMNLNFEKSKGYPRNCTALDARLLDIVRYEQARPRRARLWELEQRSKEHGK